MKETASDLVTDLQKITTILTAVITNINSAVTDLKLAIVLIPSEQESLKSGSVVGFIEKFLLTKIGF